MDRFFFLHLQKTGGTALNMRLRTMMGARAVYPCDELDGPLPDAVISPAHMLERVRARHDEIRVVTGHFPLAVTESLDGEYRTLTLLREPVGRTLSFLRHQIAMKFVATDSLEEIYADEFLFRGLIHNHMTKMLALDVEHAVTTGALADVTMTARDLDAAKATLEGIDVVGLQEDSEAFVDALRREFGWDLGPPRTANRTPPHHVEDGLVERIRSDNALDIELYGYATDLVARRRSAEVTGS